MNKHNIKLFVMDVDGTLTDGKIYMCANGELIKAFSIKDGYGIRNILIPAGIKPIIITGRKSKILERRCSEIGITDLFQNVGDKLVVLEDLCKKNNTSISEVAYIGDDLNDLSCIMAVNENNGLTGCPADAVDVVKDIVTYVSEKNAGDGAVRDFIDYIINQ